MNCRDNKDDFYYILGYSLFLFFSVLSTSFYLRFFSGNIYTVVKLLSLLFLIIHESKTGVWRKNDLSLLGIFGIIILILLSCGIAPASELVLLWVFVFCARNIDFKRVAKVTMIISIATIILIILSSYFGIIENYISQRGYMGIYRSYLGFRYSLFGPFLFLNVVTLYVYVSYGKKNYLQLLICLIFATYLYFMTDSRLAYLLTVLVIIIGFLLNHNWIEIPGRIIFIFCMRWAFVISAVISIVITILYRPGMIVLRDINMALGNRLALGHEAILEYGFTLLGQKIVWVGNGLNEEGLTSTLQYNYVDSFYLQLLLNFGVITFSLLLFLLTVVQLQFYKARNYVGMILMSVIALHGIIDDLIKYLHYNTFLLLIGIAFISYFSNKRDSVTKVRQ